MSHGGKPTIQSLLCLEEYTAVAFNGFPLTFKQLVNLEQYKEEILLLIYEMDKQAVVDKIVDKYRVFKKQIDAYIKDICVKEKREAVAYFCKDEVWATLDK